MIPSNITKAHLIRAIAEIDQQGVPPNLQSYRYDLLHNGKRYPPISRYKQLVREGKGVLKSQKR